MNFADIVKITLTERYSHFHGRASRREYWLFQLFTLIVYGTLFASLVICLAVGDYPAMSVAGFITIGVIALLLIPNIAIHVRRLHDTGRSGWWYLTTFVPYVGPVFMIILMLLKGDDDTNQFGLPPV